MIKIIPKFNKLYQFIYIVKVCKQIKSPDTTINYEYKIQYINHLNVLMITNILFLCHRCRFYSFVTFGNNNTFKTFFPEKERIFSIGTVVLNMDFICLK